MKPFGTKRDHQVELPTSGLTGRQLTTIAVAFALAIVLVPVGAKAAALINTVITDPGGVNKATVGADGNLHVSGNVSVANTPSVAASQSGDWSVGLAAGTVVGSMPGLPFQKLVAAADLDAIRLLVPITGIPDGKQLLVTHISGDLTCSLDEGQAFADLRSRSDRNRPNGHLDLRQPAGVRRAYPAGITRLRPLLLQR
jgi:hypothetical protein